MLLEANPKPDLARVFLTHKHRCEVPAGRKSARRDSSTTQTSLLGNGNRHFHVHSLGSLLWGSTDPCTSPPHHTRTLRHGVSQKSVQTQTSKTGTCPPAQVGILHFLSSTSSGTSTALPSQRILFPASTPQGASNKASIIPGASSCWATFCQHLNIIYFTDI